jgi:hypothetical protein
LLESQLRLERAWASSGSPPCLSALIGKASAKVRGYASIRRIDLHRGS